MIAADIDSSYEEFGAGGWVFSRDEGCQENQHTRCLPSCSHESCIPPSFLLSQTGEEVPWRNDKYDNKMPDDVIGERVRRVSRDDATADE